MEDLPGLHFHENIIEVDGLVMYVGPSKKAMLAPLFGVDSNSV